MGYACTYCNGSGFTSGGWYCGNCNGSGYVDSVEVPTEVNLAYDQSELFTTH
jgi:DnaJ-class molecular chaperone